MGHWSNYPFRGTNVAVRASVLKSLCSQLFLAGYLTLFGSCDLPILYVDQSPTLVKCHTRKQTMYSVYLGIPVDEVCIEG